jgi:hypothetical protein
VVTEVVAVYRNPKRLNSAEERPGQLVALWIAAGVLWLFTAFVHFTFFQQWRADNYLRRHPTQSAQASVTRVISNPGRTCLITLEADFQVPGSGARFQLTGPGKNGYVGADVLWAPCGRRGPIDFGRRVAVGDRVPVLYAVDDPAMNRAQWIDYPQRMERVRAFRWILVSLALVLTTCTIAYQNRRRPSVWAA